MYLFSRMRVAQVAHLGAAVAASVEVGQRAASTTGLPVSTWVSMMSPAANTIAWTCVVENLSDLDAGFDKLMADTGYHDMVAKADQFFTGPLTDGLAQILTPPEEEPAEMNYVSVVQAVATPGHLADAIQHGLKLAEVAGRVTGSRIDFASAATGPYGGVLWFSGAADLGTLQARGDAMNASAEFVGLVDAGGSFFQPLAEQTIFRRLA